MRLLLVSLMMEKAPMIEQVLKKLSLHAESEIREQYNREWEDHWRRQSAHVATLSSLEGIRQFGRQRSNIRRVGC